MLKEYKKTATVKAKLFENGDEDGFVHREGMIGAMTDHRYGTQPDLVPYIRTLENQFHRGEFGENYVCVGVKGERWLVDKSIFESTYEAVENKDSIEAVQIDAAVLQKLLSNFYRVCGLCDEMNIYEFPEGDKAMQEMESWTEKNFGRKIEKKSYGLTK